MSLFNVTPGKQFVAGERVTNAKLNQLGQPILDFTGGEGGTPFIKILSRLVTVTYPAVSTFDQVIDVTVPFVGAVVGAMYNVPGQTTVSLGVSVYCTQPDNIFLRFFLTKNTGYGGGGTVSLLITMFQF